MTTDPRARLQSSIRQEFGALYDQAHWPDAARSLAVTRERDELVRDLIVNGAIEATSGTKLHSGPLSRGCRSCMAGTWSCLYITERCQASCFYCPQDAQSQRDGEFVPNGEGMSFEDPELYADYVAACGVDGVGVSGGEPLIDLDRVLATVAAVKDRTEGRVYVHVYTNGLMVTRERLASLRAVGVDELRVDIAACRYETSALALAREYVDTLTVEIPAIPEDEERLTGVLGDLAAIGVDHLNLHQLFATRFNASALVARGYTLLHQRPVAVMESEFTALRVFGESLRQGIDLNVNYCCPVYKARFQPRKSMARAAALACRAHEEVTWPGYVRRVVLHDTPERLAVLQQDLRARGHDVEWTNGDAGSGAMAVGLEALRATDLGSAALTVSHFRVESRACGPVDEAPCEDSEGWEELLQLAHGRLVGRRTLVTEIRLTHPAARDACLRLLLDGWDEPREASRIRSVDVASGQELKTLLAEWSIVGLLRPGEVIEGGLGPIA
jgi:pyruvate formate-lyase activating enzyme-like uncharacterized protein